MKVKLVCSKPEHVPSYGTRGSSGFDIHSSERTVVLAGRWKLIKTGLSMEVPYGYEVQIRSRSGLANNNGVFVLNSPGTIDSDYRGEFGVILCNLGDRDFWVNIGDRIAQGVVVKIERALFDVVDTLEETERGTGGFGSTGV